jgi:hypothetical protein
MMYDIESIKAMEGYDENKKMTWKDAKCKRVGDLVWIICYDENVQQLKPGIILEIEEDASSFYVHRCDVKNEGWLSYRNFYKVE